MVKELTKRFETFWTGSVVNVMAQLGDVELRGEFVVILDRVATQVVGVDEAMLPLCGLIDAMLAEGISSQSIVKICAAECALGKNQLYQLVLQRKQAG